MGMTLAVRRAWFLRAGHGKVVMDDHDSRTLRVLTEHVTSMIGAGREPLEAMVPGAEPHHAILRWGADPGRV